VPVFALFIALYRLRSTGPWTPFTIVTGALIVFIVAVGIAIGVRQKVAAPAQANASTKDKTLALALFCCMMIFMVLIAGRFGYEAANVERWERVERAWSMTEGVVTSAAIRSSAGGRSRQVTWSPYWSYSFTVNGQQYNSTSIAFPSAYNAHWYASSAAAEADERSRPIGSVVPVYYDSERPERSVLDRRTSSLSEWILWGLCAFILGVVTFVSSVVFRAMRKPRADLRSGQPSRGL
jgi:hypothetical protein